MEIKSTLNPGSPKTLIVPVFKAADQIENWSKETGIDIKEKFSGEKKETFWVSLESIPYKSIVFLGLGSKSSDKDTIDAFRSFFFASKKKLGGEIVVDLRVCADEAEFIANGIYLASYELGMLKTREEEEKNVFNNGAEIAFWVIKESKKEVESKTDVGLKTAESQMNMMALVDAPSNYKTPEMMAEYVKKSGKMNGFKVTIYDEKECEKNGFYALLAVGRGSVDRPVRLVVMEYKGGGKKVGLVGKGVTFDTGGISIKPGSGMEDMKMDMGGSAAVIGAVELAAKLKLKVNLTGIVAFTENCVDALAIKPGDVINSYSGKTIEVINTDAEGRLILADAIHLMATKFEPEMMIDLATLTGSCIRTLGHFSAGLMTNNDKLAAQIEKAGLKTGEKVWRLPLTDDYKDELNSDVADIKNLGGPYAGASTAGKFLEYFTNEHPNWAHLDIAGTAFKKSEFSKGGSATAYGVRLLREVIENY